MTQQNNGERESLGVNGKACVRTKPTLTVTNRRCLDEVCDRDEGATWARLVILDPKATK